MSPSTGRRRWVRWIVYSLLGIPAAVGAALFLYVRWGHPEEYLRGRLVESLTQVLGRPTTIERVSLDYLPPGMTVEGLRAEGPLLSARRVEATFSLRALMRGRLVIKDLDLYDPVLRWDIDTQRLAAQRDAAGPTTPPKPDGESALARFSLRRLRIHGGEIQLGSTRHAITAEMDEMSMQADNASARFGLPGLRGPWQGSLNFKHGRFSIDDLAIDGIAGSLSIENDGDLLRAQRLHFKADQVDIRGSGIARAGPPLKGRIDLTMLLNPDAGSITRPLHQFDARQVSTDMRVELSNDGVKVSGSFTADQPSIDLDRQDAANGPDRPWTARRGVGTYMVDAHRIEVAGTLESFSGGTMDGKYVGLVQDSGGPREHNVELDARNLRLDDVLRHFDLLGNDDVNPSAAITGKASVHWQGTDRDSMVGRAALVFHPSPGELPLSGDSSLLWKGQRVTIVSSSLDTDGSHVEVTGVVDAAVQPSGGMGLKLSGTVDSADSAPLTRFIERRFGRIPAEPGGKINALFDVTGTTARPEVDARFRSSSLAVTLPRFGGEGLPRGVPIALTAVSGRLTYRTDLVRLDVDEARGEGIDLALSLQADPRTGGLLALVLNATQVPGSLLVRFAGLDPSRLRVDGAAKVTANLQTDTGALAGSSPLRGSSSLRGDIEITAGDALVDDIRLTNLKALGRLEPGKLHLGEASFDLFGGSARAEGDIDLGEGGSRGVIEITAKGIDLAAIDARYAGPSMTGVLAASGRVTLAEVDSIEATLGGEGITVAGIDLGRLSGGLKGPLSRMLFELHDTTGDLAATGSLLPGNGGDAVDIDATLTARKLSLERIRPLLPPGALAGLKGDADGVVTVTGPLIDPSSLEMHARLDRVSLTAGDYTLHNQDAVNLTEENGFLTLAPTRLIGEKTDLSIGGSMVLGGNHEVTARVVGTFDLGLIEILFPEMRASGPGTADIGVTQRGDTLNYTGTLSIADCRIAHPGLPLPLTNLKGHGEFTEQGQLRIDQIEFDMGGGKATGTGWARFEGASMPQLHLALAGRGIRAEILPELRAFFDADITLDKDYVAYQLAGRVTIQRAIYSRPFGVEASELLLRSREYAPTHQRQPGAPEVNLALEIVAEGDMWVRNEDALIEASTQLSLQGTLDRPELSGRITALEGGTYRFRDVTYRIVGGSLDFVDVTRIDPLIDIEASTRVQQYEITLRISGRFSKPIYELTADPALPQRDIVWLLLTGHTLSESPGNEASRGFNESQVASYLASPVTGAVTGPLQRLLGVSSVQIDPFFLNGTADPSARLTVTKRVAANLLFTYSSSLGQSGQEIYQMEYNPGRLWDFIATRDLDGSIGADMSIRRRWQGFKPSAPFPLPGDSGATAETPARLRVGRISVTGDHLVDSEKSLARKLPFSENDLFRRGDLLEGRETLREHYVAHGYPAAEVEMIEEEPDPTAPLRVNVRYVIRSGPRHTLEIVGPVRERPIRKAVKTAWQEPILLEDLVEEARTAALGLLKGKGFFTAKVDAGIQTPEANRRTVKLDIEPGPKVQVRSIAITGNAGMPEERIRRQMLTREKGWIDLFGGGLLKAPVLTDDIDAIRGLYLANGYLSVRVAQPSIALSEDGRKADVAIHIEEGPQCRIEAVSIEGEVPDIPPGDLMKATSLSTSQVVSTQIVELAADQLREKLDKEGYSRARVTYRLEGAQEHTHVIFSIAPAERARVKSITIEGNTRTHSGIVRREIVVKEGEYLSRSAVLATQRNLYRLGVFRSVQVESAPIESNPGWVAVRISLQEGSPILTAWGVGYDTEDRARATFEIANNNLFGTRRSAALFLRESTVDRRVQITLRDPNLFAQNIETLLSIFRERQEMTSFDLLRYGAAAQLSRKFGEHTTLFGRYRLEDIDLFNLKIPVSETGEQTVRLGSVAASIAYDTRDDIVSPTRGLLSSADARLYASGLGSEESFVRVFGSTALFKDIGHHVIWASSVRGGYLTSDAPISERFFAGGDTTLRGFSFNRVGPEDPNSHKPIGGNGLFLFNQEMRFPIFKALKGVVFYDGGNVFGEHGAHHFTDWRHVLGFGFRFDTPVGPFRVEYGKKMDREPGESAGEFFFSIGQAF